MYTEKKVASILIVEDEKIVALDIASNLKALGYLITGMVTSGDEAIHLTETNPPDLILMDIRIRGEIDGIQAAEIIRNRNDIPIVYLTASADENTLDRAKVTIPYGYIIKPFDKKTLHTMIEMALYKNSMEKKVKENERWLSEILQNMGEGMIASDALGNVKLMNKVAQSKTGWQLAEALGRNISEILNLVYEDTNVVINDAEILLNPGSGLEITGNALLKNKESGELLITRTASLIKEANNNVAGMVVVFRDITTQNNAEKEKEKLFKKVSLAQERLQIISKRTLEIQEAERRHIARELHDEIGQILTAIKINIQTAFKLTGIEKIEKHLNEGVELVEEALSQVRKLSVDLRPSMLDDLGLVPALRWYVDKQSLRSGISAKVFAEDIIKRLPSNIEITCFRVSQEALTNIIKHAQASNVEIKLFFKENELNLQIFDDGKGFDFFAAVQKGMKGESMGLLGMQERVELIGGKLKIITKPGGGTKLHAIFSVNVVNSK
jgi:PAS domain S-box-containing protein